MKIAITGAHGFIAGRLASYLSERGHEVHGLSRSITTMPAPKSFSKIHAVSYTDDSALIEAWKKIQPEFVFHTASSALSSRDLHALEREYASSVQVTAGIARTVPESVRMTFYFGSCEEYGNAQPPFREDQLPRSFSPYGWGKISALYATQWIAGQRRTPWAWLRPFLTFGEGQSSKLFIPSVISHCLQSRSIDLTLCEQTREFIYVKDLCRMIEKMLADPDQINGHVVNLCTGSPRRLRDVAEEIRALVGSGELRFGALPYRENEAMQFFGSPDLYHKLYGKPSFTPFHEALASTISAARGLGGGSL